MHFSTSLISGAVLVTSVFAQVKLAFTEWPASVTVGQPATLKWEGDSNDPVTITLRKGDARDLKDVSVLTTDAQGGTFEWTPGADLTDGSDYAFQITQDGQINYSGQFSVSGGSVSVSVSTTSTPAVTVTSPATTSTLTSSPTTTPAASYHKDGTLASKPIVGTGTVTIPRNSIFKPATFSSTVSSIARSTAATVVATSTAAGTSTVKNAPTTFSTGGSSSLTGSVTFVLSFLAAFYVL